MCCSVDEPTPKFVVQAKFVSDAADDYFRQILRRDRLQMPTTWEAAIQLYFHLVASV